MPGDEIERSGFPGAVRTDNACHLALLNRQIKIVDGHKSIERFGDVLDAKQHSDDILLMH
jgi:hypothetical protein